MKSTTRKHDSSQPVADTAVYLFDHWFDPIETWRAFRDSIWGLMLVVIIIGGIYSGIFTATEAAAVSAVYAFFVAVYVYGEIGLKDVPRVLLRSANLSAMLLYIITNAVL